MMFRLLFTFLAFSVFSSVYIGGGSSCDKSGSPFISWGNMITKRSRYLFLAALLGLVDPSSEFLRIDQLSDNVSHRAIIWFGTCPSNRMYHFAMVSLVYKDLLVIGRSAVFSASFCIGGGADEEPASCSSAGGDSKNDLRSLLPDLQKGMANTHYGKGSTESAQGWVNMNPSRKLPSLATVVTRRTITTTNCLQSLSALKSTLVSSTWTHHSL